MSLFNKNPISKYSDLFNTQDIKKQYTYSTVKFRASDSYYIDNLLNKKHINTSTKFINHSKHGSKKLVYGELLPYKNDLNPKSLDKKSIGNDDKPSGYLVYGKIDLSPSFLTQKNRIDYLKRNLTIDKKKEESQRDIESCVRYTQQDATSDKVSDYINKFHKSRSHSKLFTRKTESSSNLYTPQLVDTKNKLSENQISNNDHDSITTNHSTARITPKLHKFDFTEQSSSYIDRKLTDFNSSLSSLNRSSSLRALRSSENTKIWETFVSPIEFGVKVPPTENSTTPDSAVKKITIFSQNELNEDLSTCKCNPDLSDKKSHPSEKDLALLKKAIRKIALENASNKQQIEELEASNKALELKVEECSYLLDSKNNIIRNATNEVNLMVKFIKSTNEVNNEWLLNKLSSLMNTLSHFSNQSSTSATVTSLEDKPKKTRPHIPPLPLNKSDIGYGNWLSGERTQGDVYE